MVEGIRVSLMNCADAESDTGQKVSTSVPLRIYFNIATHGFGQSQCCVEANTYALAVA